MKQSKAQEMCDLLYKEQIYTVIREVTNNEELDQAPSPFEMIGEFVVAGLIAVGVVVCIGIAVLSLMGVAA